MALDSGRVQEIARKHGFSPEAVLAALTALERGRGSMAQFSHPDFGGSGQWMSGGMLMVGDMFNHGLKVRVAALFEDLADASHHEAAPVALESTRSAETVGAAEPTTTLEAHNPMEPMKPIQSQSWWPEDLGQPGSSGGQNDAEYAYFPQHKKLLVRRDGQVQTYDTGSHDITGFSQSQSGASDLKFHTESGTLALSELREG